MRRARAADRGRPAGGARPARRAHRRLAGRGHRRAGRARSPPSCTGSSRTGSAPASCPAPGALRPARRTGPRGRPHRPGDRLAPGRRRHRARRRSAPTASPSPSPPTTPTRTKPAPDPYLAACRALGVDPGRLRGRGGHRDRGQPPPRPAGCAVLAVPSLAPIDAAPGRTVLASLEERAPRRRLRRHGRPAAARDELEPLVRRHQGRRPPREAAQGHRGDASADVVGLQETYGTAARELAEALGWHHHQAGENLGIISRHPITARLGDPDVGFYGAAGVRIRLGRRAARWTSGGPPRLHAVRPLRGPLRRASGGRADRPRGACGWPRCGRSCGGSPSRPTPRRPCPRSGTSTAPPTWTGRTSRGR